MLRGWRPGVSCALFETHLQTLPVARRDPHGEQGGSNEVGDDGGEVSSAKNAIPAVSNVELVSDEVKNSLAPWHAHRFDAT